MFLFLGFGVKSFIVILGSIYCIYRLIRLLDLLMLFVVCFKVIEFENGELLFVCIEFFWVEKK